MRAGRKETEQWKYYHLGQTHLKRIKRFGRKFNVSTDEMEEIAQGAAIATCLKSDITDDTHAHSYFFQQVKFRLYSAAERQAFEQFDDDGKKGRGARVDVAELKVISSEGLPELSCYVGQVLKEVEALPVRLRGIMHRLILGYTPLEIADADDVSPKAVLADIRTAREWIASKDETSRGDFKYVRKSKPISISGKLLASANSPKES